MAVGAGKTAKAGRPKSPVDSFIDALIKVLNHHFLCKRVISRREMDIGDFLEYRKDKVLLEISQGPSPLLLPSRGPSGGALAA